MLFNSLLPQQTQRQSLQSLPPVVRAKTWATHLTRTKWSQLVTLLPQQCRRLLLTAHHLDQMIQWPRVRSKWRHILYFCIWLTDCFSLNDTSLIIIIIIIMNFIRRPDFVTEQTKILVKGLKTWLTWAVSPCFLTDFTCGGAILVGLKLIHAIKRLRGHSLSH